MKRRIPGDAFSFYQSLGSDRSYEAVAKRFQVTKRAVSKHATKERWQEKLAEIERKAQESAAKKAIESLEEVNARHLKLLRVMQGKALEALRSLPLRSGLDAMRALEMTIRQERAILFDPKGHGDVEHFDPDEKFL